MRTFPPSQTGVFGFDDNREHINTNSQNTHDTMLHSSMRAFRSLTPHVRNTGSMVTQAMSQTRSWLSSSLSSGTSSSSSSSSPSSSSTSPSPSLLRFVSLSNGTPLKPDTEVAITVPISTILSQTNTSSSSSSPTTTTTTTNHTTLLRNAARRRRLHIQSRSSFVPSRRLHDHDRVSWLRRAMSSDMATHRRLLALQREADRFPDDPSKQLALLHVLNKKFPKKVVMRFESGHYAMNDDVIKEYIKALAKLNLMHRLSLPEIAQLTNGYSSNDHHMDHHHTGGSSHSSIHHGAFGHNGHGSKNGGADYRFVPLPPLQQQAPLRGGDPHDPVHVALKERSMREIIGRGVVSLLVTGLALGLVYYFVTTQMKGGPGGMGSEGSYKEITRGTRPNIKFDDVKGCEEAKEELVEIVSFLRSPDRFTRLGGKLPKGCLLVGPPGTGKTLLAKAVAGEAGVPFFYASGSQFEEMYVGVGARRVRDLFAAAKKKAPALIFIDEIDAIGATRKTREHQAMRMTLNQLLVELDGFNANDSVIVIAATNFSEYLDEALVRPGRFDKHVSVDLPDARGRRDIFDLYLTKIQSEENIDTMQLARGTTGCSGADIYNIVNTAAVQAAVRGLEKVNLDILEYAKDKILMGAERKTKIMNDEDRRTTAFHEGGHAIVALFTEGSDPIHKATILPRGNALGMVRMLPQADVVSRSRKFFHAHMDVCMGGRIGEELLLGADNVTSGASSDFHNASNIARTMVMQYGMSDKVGPVRYSEEDLKYISPAKKKLIDDEVESILQKSYERAKKTLLTHEREWKRLANALLKYETLSIEEINLVVSAKSDADVDKRMAELRANQPELAPPDYGFDELPQEPPARRLHTGRS
jgi:ATP-dependent metalloprotease